MEDLDKFLTFEVKKEIAERYFGFRRIIETDTRRYMQRIVDSSIDLEKTIGHDLVCIYSLLQDESLIRSFLVLTGLPDRLFIDSYVNTSPQKDRIFCRQKPHGFTRKGCLHNLFFDTYSRLYQHVLEYRKVLKQLTEDQETIREQINLFYRKNDITSILHFLRGLETRTLDYSALVFNAAMTEDLDKKMKIEPPPSATDLLPDIPLLPAPKEIRKELRDLITRACQQQPQLDIRRFGEEMEF
jgi:hypothetical protein